MTSLPTPIASLRSIPVTVTEAQTTPPPTLADLLDDTAALIDRMLDEGGES